MSAVGSDAFELFGLLESNEADVEEIKALIHENLNQTKEPSYLNSLVDFYMNTGISKCQEILVGIREPHDKHLFEKINECLKGSTRLKALTLLGHIVHKQPSWLYKISHHTLLQTLIRILKNDDEASNLMSGILIIVTLLPIIPSSVGNFLNDIFEIFTRVAAWHTKKPDTIPHIYIMHLHVAIYSLFHRLYSMFPCNFLTYLRTYCSSSREHLLVFGETIRPMLECVRMHPMLVTFTKESEISTTRWKKMETHDIVVECAKLSLDPIEGTREMQGSCERLQHDLQRLRVGSIKRRGSFQSMTKLSPTPSKDSIIGQAVSTEMTLHWSPGLCGLSTPPPSQQISPSSSLAGYVSGLSQTSSQHGLQITNLQESSMNEFLSDTGLLTQSDKRSRSRAGTFSGSSTPYQSVPPSPLKMDASLFKFSGATVIGSDPFRLHSGELVAPTPPKTTRVPLSKVPHTALINLSKVAQKLEEQQQAQYRYPDKEESDLADFEVAAITQDVSSSHCFEMPPVHRPSPTTGLSSCIPRSGRGSAQWYKLPYVESIEEAQRTRSYSQGKKIPRRATMAVEAPLKQLSTKYRSRSLPDLNVESLSEVFVTRAKAMKRGSIENESMTDFPYEHLFDVALPYSLKYVCSRCQDSLMQQPSSGGPSVSTKTATPSLMSPVFAQMSPPEILDRYLLLCGTNHSKKTSVSVPVQSKRDASSPLQSKNKFDEIDILKGEIQLLHIQLLYERHKREIHAERNRRLLSKAKRVKALEEQNNAMKDQMQLLEKDNASLNKSIITLHRDKQHFIDEKNSEIRLMQEECASILKSKLELQKGMEDLKSEHQELTSRADMLQKELNKAQAEIFNTQHELAAIQEQVSYNTQLKSKVDTLSKELLLMTELNQKYQERHAIQQNHQCEAESSSLRDSYNYEINNLHMALESRDSFLDSLKNRIVELENLLMKKDVMITEQKRLLKYVKEEHEQLVKAVEEKHNARRLICQHLESEVLKLYQKLERVHADSRLQKSREPFSKVKQGERRSNPAVEKRDDHKSGSSLAGLPVSPGLDPKDTHSVPSDSFPTTPITDSPQPRRTSEPIDIENKAVGRRPQSRRCKSQKNMDDDSSGSSESLDEASESDFTKDDSTEQKLSGALEPITSQSLASIVDIEDGYE